MTTPLETCACPAPAKFRQLLCMSAAPQPMAKAQEFSQMLSALFITVSCKLALTELEKRTLKSSDVASTFSVLQVPQY